jgi:hypothetical protein
VVWFDYEGFFKKHPLVYRITIFLEWCFIPAHCILMHTIMVFSAFIIPQRRNQLPRNVGVILVRFTLLAALAWAAPSHSLAI